MTRYITWPNSIWAIFWLALTVPILLTVRSHPYPVSSAVLVLCCVFCLIGSWAIAIDDLRLGVMRVNLRAVSLLVVGTFLALIVLNLVGTDAIQLAYFIASAVAFVFPWQVSLPFTAVAAIVIPQSLWPFGHLSLITTGIACLASRMAIISQAQRKIQEVRSQELEVNEERNRMARDMHDILGHSLTTVTLKAELAKKLIELDPNTAKSQIAEIEEISRSALAEVRTAINGYRELSLSGELARALSLLQSAGIKAKMPNSVDEVQVDLREVFAWVVREGTTNVVRHSGAKRCSISLTSKSVLIEDDGVGIAEIREGNGLRGLRERCQNNGVELCLGETAMGGLKVTAQAVQTGPWAKEH